MLRCRNLQVWKSLSSYTPVIRIFEKKSLRKFSNQGKKIFYKRLNKEGLGVIGSLNQRGLIASVTETEKEKGIDDHIAFTKNSKNHSPVYVGIDPTAGKKINETI